MVSQYKEPPDPRMQQTQEEVRRALYDLLEGHIKLVDKTQSDEQDQATSSDEHDSNDDVAFFSDQLKEMYKQSFSELNETKSKKICRQGTKKRSRSGNEDSSDSDSSEDEGAKLELLASIAVSADDLQTSNKLKKAKVS